MGGATWSMHPLSPVTPFHALGVVSLPNAISGYQMQQGAASQRHLGCIILGEKNSGQGKGYPNSDQTFQARFLFRLWWSWTRISLILLWSDRGLKAPHLEASSPPILRKILPILKIWRQPFEISESASAWIQQVPPLAWKACPHFEKNNSHHVCVPSENDSRRQ